MKKEINQKAIDTLSVTIEGLKTLKEDQFDYSGFVSEFDEEKGCGTVCCAVGWYPVFFPDQWEWDAVRKTVVYNKNWLPRWSLAQFHNIGIRLVDHLFFPDRQDTSVFGGEWLPENAHLSEVISNFEIVLEKLKSGETDGLYF